MKELTVESAALEWFEHLGYQRLYGPDISPGGSSPERSSYSEVVLSERLRSALAALNPSLPPAILDDCFRKVTRTESPNLHENNRAFHRKLIDGVDVEYRGKDGQIVYDQARLVDFSSPGKNDWAVANQFTVIEDNNTRRMDVVVFVNGLPLGVIELKSGIAEKSLKAAYRQFQTYKAEIPGLFATNEMLVIADGLDAKAGTLTGNWEWLRL